jgi:hypothetical protein
MDFTKTDLFRRTLGEQDQTDEHAGPRTYLRQALFQFRGRAAVLAGEIHRDLPDFTVHDITHLAALWEMVDLIAGPDYPLTPLEAFALGGAFLLHDLGLGLAAWPGGLDEMKGSVGWRDTLSAHLRKSLDRAPTPEELASPPPEVERAAVQDRLRSLHAERAEEVATAPYNDPQGGATYYLIDEPDLRESLGPLLGRIAHSHWWPVARLASEFETTIGALSTCPGDWTLDPLRVAGLFRTADAAHLDARRAPGFLRAVRRPQAFSREHWVFQEHLHKPWLEEDRLVFTTARPFPPERAEAWWLCYEALQMVDHELRQVDNLLADLKKRRLQARGVAGVETPELLRMRIAISGWSPVDARIHISNVADLVERLGGEQLYGKDPTVPLRELIQNAADAVRARRLLEGRDDKWGRVTVRLGRDEEGPWIEVEDTGIGMSEAVLSGSLLDFGTTYWGSALMREEHEGLWAKGFEPTGRFGIGFFSVFLWGHRVQVTSRRYDAGKAQTHVLEFRTGVEARPLLRPALPAEQPQEVGTRVRVWLSQKLANEWDLLSPIARNHPATRPDEIGALCAWLAPALDVDLYVDDGKGGRCVVEASDWLTLDQDRLLRRVLPVWVKAVWRPLGDNLRTLQDPKGGVLGRATLCESSLQGGIVTVGGFRAGTHFDFTGILLGSAKRAARDRASLLAAPEILAAWASEQALIAAETAWSPGLLHRIASRVAEFRGYTGSLPIAKRGDSFVSFEELSTWKGAPRSIVLLTLEGHKALEDVDLKPDVLAVLYHSSTDAAVFRVIQAALAKAWSCSEVELSHLDRHRTVEKHKGEPLQGDVFVIHPKGEVPDLGPDEELMH